MSQTSGARTPAPVSALLLGLLLAGCSTAESTEWVEYRSASGAYTAQFPARPIRESEKVPGTAATVNFVIAERGEDAYGIAEMELPKGLLADLEGAADGAINGSLGLLEKDEGEQGSATEVSRKTGTFEKVETREVVADLTVGDRTSRLRLLLFAQDGRFVQVLAIDGSNDAAADVARFFESFE